MCLFNKIDDKSILSLLLNNFCCVLLKTIVLKNAVKYFIFAHIKHMSIFKKKKKKFQSKTDPLGSYTGVPENPYEQPVQDADDL